MNNVIVTGYIARDMELKVSQTSKEYTKSAIGVQRLKKEGEEIAATDFINFAVFGASAKYLSTYAKKGTRVLLQGSWQTGSYKDKEGKTVYTNDLIVNHCEILSSNSSDEDSKKDISSSAEIDDDLPF